MWTRCCAKTPADPRCPNAGWGARSRQQSLGAVAAVCPPERNRRTQGIPVAVVRYEGGGRMKESGLFLPRLVYDFRCLTVRSLGLGACRVPIYFLAVVNQFFCFGLHLWVCGERVQLGSTGSCLNSAVFQDSGSLVHFSRDGVLRKIGNSSSETNHPVGIWPWMHE